MDLKERITRVYEKYKRVISHIDGYWIYAEHSSPINDILNPFGPDYDGKWVVRMPFDELEDLSNRLTKYVKSGEIIATKYKDPKTPMSEEHINDVPPLFVYSKNRNKEQSKRILEKENAPDLVWIEDGRSTQEMLQERYGINYLEVVHNKTFAELHNAQLHNS